MRVKDYEVNQLYEMPLSIVRNLEVETKEEEITLQAVVNERVLDNPLQQPVTTFGIPDIKTPEEEAKWQKVMDERNAKARNIDIQDTPVAPEVPNEVPELPPEEIQPENIVPEVNPQETVAKFCEFCTSKGVKHLKTCTRPK